MPLIQKSVSIAANTTVDDVLVNHVLAIAQSNQRVDMALVASAVGITCDVNVGTRQIAPGIIPSQQNRVPIMPDDVTVRFGMRASDRVILKAVNSTGGAITLYYTLVISPLQ